MPPKDPYKIEAGPELDLLVHVRVMGNESGGDCPAYSSEQSEARKVVTRLRSHHHLAVAYGRTTMRSRGWFARYGLDPSTATEVISATLPLAICRLALLAVAKGA
jgi:hypothetical protein